MSEYNALSIVRYLLEKKPLSNLTIQKLLYLIQAKSLSVNDSPVFNDDIQAWRYGPVVPSVYSKLNGFGSSNIDLDTLDFILQWNSIEVSELDERTESLVHEVFLKYGNRDPFELVDLTHSFPAWNDAFEEGENIKITNGSIKRCHKDKKYEI